MSKAKDAKVRDELLQALYATVLRVRLAQSLTGNAAPAGAEALAAGISANLREPDLLALPPRGSATLRSLRAGPPARDLRRGLLTLPRAETSAVNFVLGAVSAAAHGGSSALVVVLLPSSAKLAGRFPGTGTAMPETWAEAGTYAAQHSLPLLFLSDGLAGVASRGPEERPPAFPTIPVDRDDALAIYRVAFECAERARLGAGPSHLACVPFRPRGQAAAEPDALARLETMLRARGAFEKTWRQRLERRLVREVSGN